MEENLKVIINGIKDIIEMALSDDKKPLTLETTVTALKAVEEIVNSILEE